MNRLNTPVRWEEHFAPFSLGLGDMFRQLDAYADNGTALPPYNIRVVSDTEQVLELALAGYDREQLSVAVEKGTLTISANKKEEEEEPSATYTHRGVAQRTFARNWKLGPDAEVGEVTFTNGLLSVNIAVQVPEAQKRRLLPIS